MNFTKMQATGNDFVVFDARTIDVDWPSLAKDACRRHFGIGSDGLILILDSEKADFRMRMFNPDGSEAEACGNGLRCFVRYVIGKSLTDKIDLKVETLAGIREAKYQNDLIRVEMGQPQLAPEQIPAIVEGHEAPVLNYPLNLNGWEFEVSLVSMGNPHAIHFLNDPIDSFPLSTIGPQIEHHQMFPNRTNFEIVNIVNRNELKARVWERGAGETWSCGSGACAIAVAARLSGITEDLVQIELPGGILKIEWDGVGQVWLSGPAEFVFEGTWSS